MNSRYIEHLSAELQSIRQQGLYKNERIIVGPQGTTLRVEGGKEVLNFCSNNYLGLSNHPHLIESAKNAMDNRGFGMSSVRFICGTQDIHRQLEIAISTFFGTDDAILYIAAFDANGGLFEPLFSSQDAIISDTLNHASIIDGVRLCKAQRYTYRNADMEDLEEKLKLSQAQRYRIVITDGVFSMDGNVAPMGRIMELANKYNALVAVDESHSAGVVGPTGKGVTELFSIRGEADIITGTLGKAFGGGCGGFTTGRQEIIDILRQRSRPYLFSNSVPPPVVGAGIEAFKLLESNGEPHSRLVRNAEYFKKRIAEAGYNIKPSRSAIVAVMLYDASLAQEMAAQLLTQGIYVVGFFYPVVPKGEARVRVQLSAEHTIAQIDTCVDAFLTVGRRLGVID
jgi:glycine C-acetyltransferase